MDTEDCDLQESQELQRTKIDQPQRLEDNLR